MTKRKLLKSLALVLTFSVLAPFSSKTYAADSEPSIKSEAAIVVDYDTGEIIYEKNANDKKFLASTTKLMTALLFAQNKQKTDNLTYSQDAKNQPPYTLDNDYMKPYRKSLNVGDTISADTIMKGLLLFSGNDTAYVIADNVSSTSQEFVTLMNNKATELGLKDTHFENPNGLPVNGSDVNYSTAYELSIITKAAYENDWIREVMSMSNATVTLPQNTIVTLQNRNTELNKNGNIGGKTGVTDAAGTCFAGVYERDGRKLIGVVLKCDRNNNDKRFEDLKSMMDYSYDAKKETFKEKGSEVGDVTLNYKIFGGFGPEKSITVPVTLADDVELYKNNINDNEASINFDIDNTNAWKAASNKTVPVTVSVKQYSEKVDGTIELTKGTLIKANLLIYISIVAAVLVVIILIVVIINLIRKAIAKKSRSSYGRRRRY